MHVINALREKGRVVSEDVAVVGYDDIELSSYFHPPLTTVRQPVREAGRAMVAALLQQTEGQNVASIQLPTSLVSRSSSL